MRCTPVTTSWVVYRSCLTLRISQVLGREVCTSNNQLGGVQIMFDTMYLSVRFLVVRCTPVTTSRVVYRSCLTLHICQVFGREAYTSNNQLGGIQIMFDTMYLSVRFLVVRCTPVTTSRVVYRSCLTLRICQALGREVYTSNNQLGGIQIMFDTMYSSVRFLVVRCTPVTTSWGVYRSCLTMVYHMKHHLMTLVESTRYYACSHMYQR